MVAGSNKKKMDEEECCPKFDPGRWDGKIVEWDKKRFVKEHVPTFFNIPIRFGKVMKQLDEHIRDAGATVKDGLGLSDHTSKWNMDVYVAVDKKVPGLKNTTMSGTFLSKVYEGPYKDTGKWCKDFEAYAKEKHIKITKWYMWYTTCPKCAKKYGKNYVAIIGKIE